MNTDIKHAKSLKYGLLGITLATAAYITQTTTSFGEVSLTSSYTAVQLKRSDTPSLSKLWAGYETVFLEQEQAINQAFTEVETATDEIDKLIAEIDLDMSELLLADANAASIRLSFTAEY